MILQLPIFHTEKFIYNDHHMEYTLKIRSSMQLKRQIAFSRKGYVTNVIARQRTLEESVSIEDMKKNEYELERRLWNWKKPKHRGTMQCSSWSFKSFIPLARRPLDSSSSKRLTQKTCHGNFLHWKKYDVEKILGF